MARIIQVSFKDDEEDMLQEIEKQAKHVGKSGWIKQAIAEKLEREKNSEIKIIDAFIKGK